MTFISQTTQLITTPAYTPIADEAAVPTQSKATWPNSQPSLLTLQTSLRAATWLRHLLPRRHDQASPTSLARFHATVSCPVISVPMRIATERLLIRETTVRLMVRREAVVGVMTVTMTMLIRRAGDGLAVMAGDSGRLGPAQALVGVGMLRERTSRMAEIRRIAVIIIVS